MNLVPACAPIARETFLPDPTRGVVLITRPSAGAIETARRVAALGFTPLVAPVLETVMSPTRLPEPARLQAVILTSANAVPCLSAAYFQVPVFAVGAATAAAARKAGFARVIDAGGKATDLAVLVRRLCEPGRGSLLFPGAATLAADIAKPLRAAGFRVIRRIVYRTTPVAALSQTAHDALGGGWVKAALFFSPASARSFVALVTASMPPTYFTGVDAVAISAAVAAALEPLPWRHVHVASLPNQDAMLALLT